jgi:hypothetical protein
LPLLLAAARLQRSDTVRPSLHCRLSFLSPIEANYGISMSRPMHAATLRAPVFLRIHGSFHANLRTVVPPSCAGEVRLARSPLHGHTLASGIMPSVAWTPTSPNSRWLVCSCVCLFARSCAERGGEPPANERRARHDRRECRYALPGAAARPGERTLRARPGAKPGAPATQRRGRRERERGRGRGRPGGRQPAALQARARERGRGRPGWSGAQRRPVRGRAGGLCGGVAADTPPLAAPIPVPAQMWAGTGLTPLHLHQDWTHPCHMWPG